MYFTEIKDITNPFLHDAAHTLSLRVDAKGDPLYKFRSLHIDPSGECAISYYGKLPEYQIKEIMLNYCCPGKDKSFDDIHPKYHQDYEYHNGHHSNGETEYTTIFTPDGIDYKHLTL